MAYYYSPFRKHYGKKDAGGCPFCDTREMRARTVQKGGKPVENKSYRWIVNAYPKFEGHTMLVPKRHLTAIGKEPRREILDREELLLRAVKILGRAFPKAGFEIFLQTGTGSESSVPHLHWHVVPASPDDHLRSFDKLGHFYTVEDRKEKVILFPQRIKHSPKQLLKALSGATKPRRK